MSTKMKFQTSWEKSLIVLSFIESWPQRLVSLIIVTDSSFIQKQSTNLRLKWSLKLDGKKYQCAFFDWELKSLPPAY